LSWADSPLSFFSALDVNTTRLLGTQFSAFDEVCLHLLDRDTFLVLPRPGNQHVLDIFSERLVRFEVDNCRCLAAFRVSDELNSGHAPSLLWAKWNLFSL